MDEVQRLIEEFSPVRADQAWKLDVLLDLERHRDRRVVPLLLDALSDSREAKSVRLAVLMHLASDSLLGV